MTKLFVWTRMAIFSLVSLLCGLALFAVAEDEPQKEEEASDVVESTRLQKQVTEHLQKYYDGDKEARPKLLKSLDAYLAQREKDVQQLRTAYTAAQVLEMNGAYEDALSVLKKSKELFAKGENKDLSAAAEELYEQATTRLEIVGKPLIIEGALADGGKFDMKKYDGKIVLVDFWATWCGPCREELPNVKENYKKFKDKGFDVVGVSLDDDKDALDKFLKDEEIPWENLFGETEETRGWEHPLVAKLNIDGIPATYLLDRTGVVRFVNVRGEALGERLEELLAENSDAKETDPKSEVKE